MLIGFTGPAGAGKSTAAAALVEWLGFVRHRFADPLKRALAALGASEAMLEGHLKAEPVDLFCGRTPRHAMQTLGTEWGRELIGADFWVNAWRRGLPADGHVVVDDVRFPNEVAAIRQARGIIVAIDRPGLAAGGHVSERGGLEADMRITNDRPTADDFANLVVYVFEASVRGL